MSSFARIVACGVLVFGAAAVACTAGAVATATTAPPVPDTALMTPGPVAELASGTCGRDFGAPEQSPYRLPFPAGRTYTMFQGNCPPDLRWGHRGWLAYDFDLAIGDTVIASRAGTVRWVVQNWPDSDRRCGQENGVWITHDDSTIMAYVHFTTNGARVKVGDRVEAGALIGLSGDSGCSSAPHLHVNLMRNGTSRQKENLLPFNYRNATGPVGAKRELVQGARYTARPRP